MSHEQTRELTLSWKLHEVQREAFEANARFQTCAWGRRTGKNVFAAVDASDYALNPEADPYGGDDEVTVWWIGPTYTQAYDYGWGEDPNAIGVTDLIPDELIAEKKRSDPRRLTLTNGSAISFRTFDHPESLDGAGVDHIIIDEAAMMPSKIWHQTLRPMLSDTNGKAIFISKPKGKNWFHDHYLRGGSDEWPEWWSSQAPSYVNPFVDDSEIDKAARGTPDRLFKQEYLAVFLGGSGGVFREVRERNVEDYDWEVRDGNAPYTWGWDFARHQNWTVGICLDWDGLLVDWYRDQPATWDRLQDVMESRYERYPGVMHVDASRDNKLVSDLENAGIPIEAVIFSTQTKRDLINTLAVRLENGELTIPDIPQLVNELELYEYDTTPSGNVRYHAPEGWNDDAVDALALAARESATSTSGTWGPGREVRT